MSARVSDSSATVVLQGEQAAPARHKYDAIAYTSRKKKLPPQAHADARSTQALLQATTTAAGTTTAGATGTTTTTAAATTAASAAADSRSSDHR
jgi:hypothetical protein